MNFKILATTIVILSILTQASSAQEFEPKEVKDITIGGQSYTYERYDAITSLSPKEGVVTDDNFFFSPDRNCRYDLAKVTNIEKLLVPYISKENIEKLISTQKPNKGSSLSFGLYVNMETGLVGQATIIYTNGDNGWTSNSLPISNLDEMMKELYTAKIGLSTDPDFPCTLPTKGKYYRVRYVPDLEMIKNYLKTYIPVEKQEKYDIIHQKDLSE